MLKLYYAIKIINREKVADCAGLFINFEGNFVYLKSKKFFFFYGDQPNTAFLHPFLESSNLIINS